MTAEEPVGDNKSDSPTPTSGPDASGAKPARAADKAGDAAANDGASDAGEDAAGVELEFDQDRMEPEILADADLEADAGTDIEAQLQRADENWERVLRMQADMENQRKRSQKDVENARKFALEGMVNDLLPIRDSLEMGIAAARETDTDAEKIIEGSDLTLKMLSQAFEKYNINVVDPIDQKFDPEFHQAMSMQAVEGKEPNTVTAVLQKGYTLNDRLLRPALVMVAK